MCTHGPHLEHIRVTKSKKDSEKVANYESKTNESFVEKLDPTDSSPAKPIARAVDSPYVSFENGRADLQDIIQHEIEKASGRMSVNGKLKLKFPDYISSHFLFP